MKNRSFLILLLLAAALASGGARIAGAAPPSRAIARIWRGRTLAPKATYFFTLSGACADLGRLVRTRCRA